MTFGVCALPDRKTINTLNHRFNAVFNDAKTLAFCERYYGLKIEHHHEAFDILGGDLWGIYPFGEDEVFLYLFDFVGHDFQAAQNAIIFHSMAQRLIGDHVNPSVFMEKLNTMLRESPIFPTYATMFVAIYNIKTHTLCYSNASGPSLYLLSSRKNEPITLTAPSLPLGAKHGVSYREQAVELAVGDKLMLYSDALTETKTLDNGRIFEARFNEILNNYCKKCYQGNQSEEAPLFANLMQTFKRSCVGNISDDLTVLLLTIKTQDFVRK